MCAGVTAVNGKPNPLALVKIVVARKSAVHPSSRAPASSPPATTSPAMMPTTLMRTWIKVNMGRSAIITTSPSPWFRLLLQGGDFNLDPHAGIRQSGGDHHRRRADLAEMPLEDGPALREVRCVRQDIGDAHDIGK